MLLRPRQLRRHPLSQSQVRLLLQGLINRRALHEAKEAETAAVKNPEGRGAELLVGLEILLKLD
jgi:hypothetical protein